MTPGKMRLSAEQIVLLVDLKLLTIAEGRKALAAAYDVGIEESSAA